MESLPTSFENRYAKFWIADGILFFKYREGLYIDLSVAKRVVADRLSFQNEVMLPVLCDSRGIVFTDKAARDYLASSGSLMAKAVALLVKENASLTLSTFYLKINKPSVPTQIFTEKEQALEFLSMYR